MQIHTIDTGLFKLDGGAMFGVVPKMLWSRKYPADSNNLCTWAMRCLLVEEGNRLILIDTGLGDKQSDKFFSYYEPHGDDTLLGSIQQKGYTSQDITDVVLTHLHFDHCGGAVKRVGEQLVPTFPNATYWSHEDHWAWATNPNPRERASFLSENILPLQESGQLQLLSGEKDLQLFDGFRFRLANGHTEKQLIPEIDYKGHTLVYMADLLPSHVHLPAAWVMAYDTRPLLTMQEKPAFLREAAENEYILVLEHDTFEEAITVQQTEKGITMKDSIEIAAL